MLLPMGLTPNGTLTRVPPTASLGHGTSSPHMTSINYQGRDRVQTVHDNGMHISHIGHSILHTPSSSLHLKNILHFPSASKNLLSVNKLAMDNNVFLEFHPYFFLIKDQATIRIMFKGPYYGGLYPLVPFSTGYSKQVFNTIMFSSSR
jgi:hypothetical protein